jgi:hypothetical protein
MSDFFQTDNFKTLAEGFTRLSEDRARGALSCGAGGGVFDQNSLCQFGCDSFSSVSDIRFVLGFNNNGLRVTRPARSAAERWGFGRRIQQHRLSCPQP